MDYSDPNLYVAIFFFFLILVFLAQTCRTCVKFVRHSEPTEWEKYLDELSQRTRIVDPESQNQQEVLARPHRVDYPYINTKQTDSDTMHQETAAKLVNETPIAVEQQNRE